MTAYFNGKNRVSKEAFEQERTKLLEARFKELDNKENLIPYEDLDYYLDALKKFGRE